MKLTINFLQNTIKKIQSKHLYEILKIKKFIPYPKKYQNLQVEPLLVIFAAQLSLKIRVF